MKEKDKDKNGKYRILKLFTIFILSISILFAGNSIDKKDVVYADSGFDISYDSGSSSDWGSSSSDWGDSDYSGGGGFFFGSFSEIIIFIVIMIIIAIAKAGKNDSGTATTQNTGVNEEAVLNRIKQYIPDFNKEQFLNEGYKIYTDIQNAWTNFKLEDVQNVLTDEMFNMYQSQLDTLEVKGEQNIMKDFKRVNAYVKDVVKQNDNITITAGYVVEFYDYIVDKASGNVLRGSSTSKIRVTYDMKFRRTLDQKLTIENCPNCGAKIEDMNGSGTCIYCGSKLVSENAKWVLTDKKTINQTRI